MSDISDVSLASLNSWLFLFIGMTWKDINVFQWQQLADLQNTKEGMTDEQLSIKTIAIITNLTEQQIKDMGDRKLFRIAGKIKFLQKDFEVQHAKYIKTKGKRYRCVYDVKKMPTARYVESKHFAANFNENIHRIAASMVIPQKRILVVPLILTPLPLFGILSLE